MSVTPDRPNKGTNLEPVAPWEDSARDRRSQLELFLDSNVPEANEVRAAVDETFGEYRGFIDLLAQAAEMADTRDPNFRESAADYKSGIERIARFAVWRAMVNREREARAQEPPHVQGFIDMIPVTAALSGIPVARIQAHGETDEIHRVDIEGEQS